MRHLVGLLAGLVIVLSATMILFGVVGYDPLPAPPAPGFTRGQHFWQWLKVEKAEFQKWVSEFRPPWSPNEPAPAPSPP